MNTAAITRNPNILGGTPVFAGTRVPIRILFEHIEAGDRIDEFLKDFPSVDKAQVHEVLETASDLLTSNNDEAAA